jgi:hypothetical protein
MPRLAQLHLCRRYVVSQNTNNRQLPPLSRGMILVPDLEGYAVCADGSLWSCWGRGRGRFGERWRRVRGTPCGDGYVSVTLQGGKTYLLHRLILLAFVGPKPSGQQSRHLDGNPANNALDNLCYGTPQKNRADRTRHGRDAYARGSRHGAAKLTEEKVRNILRLIAREGRSQQEIAVQYDVRRATISAIVAGRTWRHVQREGTGHVQCTAEAGDG